MIPLSHILILSCLLFALGIIIISTKRNAIVVAIGIELIFNAANLNFITFSQHDKLLQGQSLALFIMAITAAETALLIAIIARLHKHFKTIQLDELEEPDNS